MRKRIKGKMKTKKQDEEIIDSRHSAQTAHEAKKQSAVAFLNIKNELIQYLFSQKRPTEIQDLFFQRFLVNLFFQRVTGASAQH